MNPLPRWRIAAGGLVLAALLLLAALFTPVYVRNLKLQSYVDGITHRVASDKQSDQELRDRILQRAHELDLPVTAGDVHIVRNSDGLRIDVRYAVTIHAPLYRVDMHFYPGAGSR